MKRLLKISLSVLLLALAFAVTQIPVESVTADTTSVSTDADFQMNGTTLVKYTGTAKTVSVPASVVTIGDESFADHTEIETIQFKGNLVEDISYRAFAGCSGIKEIKLPKSVTELGNGVFGDCSSLEKVEFGSELRELGIGPFANCPSLKSIIVPKENNAFLFEDGCLYNKEKSKIFLMLPSREKDTYTMPSTVTDIAEYAFWNCDKLKGVSLSGNLKEIPDYSFANCKSLNCVTIPYSVNTIGLKAFSDCVNLLTADIPPSVSNIHDTAFDGCSKLVISAEEGTAAYQFYKLFKQKNQAEYEDSVNIVQPNSEDDDQKDPSNDNSSDSGNVLASTYVVGNKAVFFIDNSDNSVYGIVKQNDSVSGGNKDSLENDRLGKGTDIPKYTVAFDSIISDLAFYQSRKVSDYSFPEKICEIGEFAFARSNISEVQIPSGVTTIGYGAFYHCEYLRQVSIPSSVISIAPEAFAKSMWLDNWLKGTGSDDYLIVGDGILLAYRGSGGNIIIPDTVKRIGSQVFTGNNTILSAYLPDSVIEIGEDAFRDCMNLSEITGGNHVRIIRDRAFSGCVMDSAHIWENVEHIGLASYDFTNVNAGVSSKVVVFDHKEGLPKPSYELTAERLSNDLSRKYLLGDTSFAIVDKKIKVQDLEGTVLDPDGNGFRGIIAYISSKDKGIVTCIATTYSEEEFKNAYIPEYITIDGKNYQVTGKENVTVFGQERESTEGTIVIENNATTSINLLDASLEGNTGFFTLKVSDSEDAYETINKGYEEVYREALPENVLCVQINLIDIGTDVPITRTGKQDLQMTVDLPTDVCNGSIRILTVDRNGQLENIPYTREDQKFTFSVNHLSPFAFVNVNSQGSNVFGEGNVVGENAVISSFHKQDDSPDTGDPIHPKWFLALGLTCMAIAVLFIKKSNKA